jgi:hypothetical protein
MKIPPEAVSIQVRIFGFDNGRQAYPVEAALDDGRKFTGELRLKVEDLLALQLEAQAYGVLLFDALFAGPIRDAYLLAIGRAGEHSGDQLRVQLWLDNTAATLNHQISWERLYDTHTGRPRPMAASADTPFSRYIGLPSPEPEPVDERPLRILVAVANPKDLPPGLSPIQVADEVQGLAQALAELRQKGQVALTFMPGRTGLPENLRAQLDQPGYEVLDVPTGLDDILRHLPDHHALHFVGHGIYQRQRERAALYLEKPNGTWQAVDDETIAAKLGNIRPQTRLVFLSACESARGEGRDPFVGLGPKLVQAGVPAVVAMREQVSMDVARQLTADFYQRLLDHGQVDLALNEARNLLLNLATVDWAIPVLFMRLREGRLLSASGRPQAKESRSPAGERTHSDQPLTREDRVRIRQNLVEAFNLSELRTLCTDLDIDYENFPATKPGLARELFLYCERRQMVDELAELCRQERPEFDW